ncbi:MAG TPA: 3,4-dihydroxy-2-butanone-4-phosphate synthase [bacterium]|nr:3,4-dihydroxy-2-butanone-4-phosphate synthase [bacterium]HMY36357.1 3,4-dihydroxy-2-butanone-4-phosphate synthase [bacterium]HMZ05217.1 3,4-dihydroxy-2-butanone-4-phosphate synthase [bacterium]HNB10046.1 3,4-dihydroxy-2-butanone-4-phosphate synthase [bacterium]HNB56552.1 3,4-dihydroxy-2-butanone-4-phosphate synthase [bacterium]
MHFNTIEEAVEDYKKGKIVIVVDDEDRENEGDFIMAAEKVTPDAVNFMAKHGRGLICLSITRQRASELELNIMVDRNTSLHTTPFTVSIDAKEGTTTGISAADRAKTISVVIDPVTRPEDLARPGHVFPLVARDGGVLERSGHTEATVDLARLAGLYPAGILCEIMDDDGSMARVPRLMEMAKTFDLKIITIKDLIEYRRRMERFIRPVVKDVELPSRYGNFSVTVYENILNGDQHIAITKGLIKGEDAILVRVQVENTMGDVFGSLTGNNSSHVSDSLRMIESAGRGVVLYLRENDQRSLGLFPSEEVSSLDSHHSRDTDKDWRTLGVGSQILVDLGVRRLKLLTNNRKKYVGLEGYGLEIVEQIPIVSQAKV